SRTTQPACGAKRISAWRRLTELSSRTISSVPSRPARMMASDSQVLPLTSSLMPRRRMNCLTANARLPGRWPPAGDRFPKLSMRLERLRRPCGRRPDRRSAHLADRRGVAKRTWNHLVKTDGGTTYGSSMEDGYSENHLPTAESPAGVCTVKWAVRPDGGD